MTTFVVDVRVAIKWCVPSEGEDFGPAAIQLLRSYTQGSIDFLVPDLFWVQLGNAFWKCVRSGKMSRDAADFGLRTVRGLAIKSLSSTTLLNRAFDIAIAHECSFYDGLYIALAVESSTQFVTADERLAKALAARFPIKWLGGM